jgi:hypothetical protein
MDVRQLCVSLDGPAGMLVSSALLPKILA